MWIRRLHGTKCIENQWNKHGSLSKKYYFLNNFIEDNEFWQDILKYLVKYNERERGSKQTNCDTLREIALKVLVSEGQVDWKTIYLVYPFTKKEQWYAPIAIDLLIYHESKWYLTILSFVKTGGYVASWKLWKSGVKTVVKYFEIKDWLKDEREK